MVDTVAIQGEAGSFSHAAALEAYGPGIRLVPCATFVELFRSVETGQATSGMVPIENTLAGSVHENYDLLSAHQLHVVGEAELRIRHCLIASPHVGRADVRRVASHPVALAQCRRFFTEHPELVAVPAYDTAGSVRDLMAGTVNAEAAIASRLAASLYGATILEEGLEDNAENYTRFLVVTRDPLHPAPGQASKTSLMFTLGSGPGTLHQALGVFAERGLNLTKIESRPLPGRPWEYLFYADVVDTPVSRIDEGIEALRGVAFGVRVLGTYPAR
ncbi:MAG TPA: prephenate dehydratase [Gemmatimonadales bacterium]|nr:prephenate dehydratase [Gemmatimonadales bacterium]